LSLLQAGLGTGGMRLAVLWVPVLGLIGALALACFAKVFGIVFLGAARDRSLVQPHESPRGMVRPMVGLAAACAAIGLLPVLAIPPVLRVGALLAAATGTPATAPADPVATAALPAVSAATPLTLLALGLAGALLA